MTRLVLSIAAGCALAALAPLASASADTTLTVATVNNSQMLEMEKLTPVFEKEHPGIHIRYVTLEENVLRQRVTTDIATHGGQFDVLTIGNYEVPIWAKQGWIAAFDNLPTAYDVGDIIKNVRNGISYKDKIYGLPFYAESAMTYYRTDLFKQAGLTMPAAPTYTEFRQFADKLTDKSKEIYGVCLRGKPGWGENMAYVTTLVTAMGGQYFNMAWKPVIDSPAWTKALSYYDAIMKADGPPGASTNGFNENLALFTSGHCGMWIDATSAAGTLYDKKQSKVADEVGFAAIPTGSFKGGPTWLWSWNLAIPSTSKQIPAAKTFVEWATSKEYTDLVGKTDGWVNAPPGTRTSTYDNPAYKKVAPFSSFVLKAIQTSNPTAETAHPRPYVGGQYAGIPQFQGIGTAIGQIVAGTLTGQTTVKQALATAQASTARTMQEAGYYH
jgi:sorbitol/mannitol transport system substrate-binding protein